jgi:Thaumatin family
MKADVRVTGRFSGWAITLLTTFLLMSAVGCSNDSNSPTVTAPEPLPANAPTPRPTPAASPTAKPTVAPTISPTPIPTASPTPGPLACNGATEYTYTFTNYCRYPVWLAQLRAGDSTGYAPVGGNWAIAGACSKNSDCLSGSVCSGGQCTCASSADCAGGASCTSGLCSNTDVFCMPQNWASGRFWPRTGCTSGAGDTLTCDTGQCGTTGQLDCDTVQKSGDNPATLFEVTSSTGGVVNYDVSVVDGGNATLRATPVDSSARKGIDCIAGGCTADLKVVCPANLRITIPAHNSNPDCVRGKVLSRGHMRWQCLRHRLSRAMRPMSASQSACRIEVHD